ncbi:MAG: S8 family serine peptidase, partial [Alloacidobacterium sp.]
MKICPFCREEIREDAVKCRYCGSSLLPGQPTAEKSDTGPSASADQVIYVVDQGLIRFAKFALAILALFVAVGAALYGFDIQKGVDKVREGVDKVRDSEDSIQKMRISLENQIREIQKTSEQIERSRQNVSDNEGKVQDLRNEAQSFVDWIERNKPAVLAFVARIPAAGVEITQAAIIPQSDRPWFTAPELAKLYDIPVDLNGDGQTIGFLELGGGFRESDLDSYFAALHVSKPNVEWVSVDGAKNQPQESNTGADGQVANDIEIAGAIAYGAKIRVYFAPNTDAGFVDVVRKAVADRVTILSISWGAPESVWSKKGIAALNSALESAAKQGITVLCATGDLGAADGVEDGKAHVDFPSSSPWVLAIGGTRLKASNGAISSEVVWNDGSNATGGGV